MELLSFPHSASWVVKSNKILYSGLSSATLTITATAPTVNYRLKITPSSVTGHTDLSGTMVVGTETITLSGTTPKTTTYTNTAGTRPAITCSNIDCSLLIECLDTLGHAIQEETLTAIQIRYEPTTKPYMGPGGTWTQSASYAMVVNSSIGIGSVIRYLSKDYTVAQTEAFSWIDGSEVYRILYF